MLARYRRSLPAYSGLVSTRSCDRIHSRGLYRLIPQNLVASSRTARGLRIPRHGGHDSTSMADKCSSVMAVVQLAREYGVMNKSSQISRLLREPKLSGDGERLHVPGGAWFASGLQRLEDGQ